MAYLQNKDFYLEVVKGNIPKHSDYSVTGLNTDIDTGTPEDVISNGGTFVPPTTNRVHDIVSSNINDTSAGTGLRTVRIYGVTSTGFETEDITMNGTTNVPTVKSYYDIYDIVPLTFGSGLTNAGIITATAQTDATVTNSIQIDGTNSTLRAVRYIPSGYTGYVVSYKAAMSQSTATSFADVHLQVKENGVWRTKGIHLLNNTGNSNETDNGHHLVKVEGGKWIKVRCTDVTNNNTKLYADLVIILVQN